MLANLLKSPIGYSNTPHKCTLGPNTHANARGACRCVHCCLLCSETNRFSYPPNQDRVSIVQGGYVSSSVNKSLPAKKAGNILNKPRGDSASSGATSSSAGGGNFASGNNNEASEGGPPAAVLSVSTCTPSAVV